MENLDVAQVLSDLADLLEIQDANAFRVRAYRNAARSVRATTRRLQDMLAAGEDLTELPAIGREIARHVEELLATGQLRRLEELSAKVPRSVAELMKLDGVGPRKARRLWERLGVESVAMLEEQVRAGRVAQLEGFGQSSAARILKAIENRRDQAGRFPRAEVEQLVQGLLRWVRETPGVQRAELVGSFRRGRETVRDVDILVLSDGDGAAVIERFAAYPDALRVGAAGETKGSLVLRSGLKVDLRVVPGESWGAALHYFTGSKEHNVRIRALAVSRGLRLNEWGVFELDERVGGETELEVFSAVGLPWIPPELREDRGEVEAAGSGRLPNLLELQDLLGDLHAHSTWSDGRDSIRDMARASLELGYEYLCVTDHSQSLTMAGGLTPDRVRRQWAEIDEVQEGVGLSVLKGLEVDILRDGSLDMPASVLEELDLVVASVHSSMNLPRAVQTERVIRAIQNPNVDVLGHPTGRLLGRRPSYALDVESVLQTAAENDVAVELNASPKRLDLSDVHVRRARELGVKVAVNTDAHSVKGLHAMRFGVGQARRGWLERGDVLNTMSALELADWLQRRGA